MRRKIGSKAVKCKCFRVIATFVSVILVGYVGLVGLILASSPSPSPSSWSHPPTLVHNTIVYRKPPLTSYIQGWNITRDVSWLLDFAIIGFPKTGTSTLMLYLEKQTDSVFIFSDERCEIGCNQQVPLLKDLHKNYQPHLKMGIKCPRDLELNLALENYDKFFGPTKFIVGLRHPILWFQSFYNFRVTNEFEMPPAELLIGKCRRNFQGLCTQRAKFSKHLSRIDPSRKVFLYDVAQLQDSNPERATQFRQDLGSFLELPRPLQDPMIWVKPGHKPMDPSYASEIASNKINICHSQYAQLRDVLGQQASESAIWIQNTFLANPNVHVSSSQHFAELLDSWHYDPCNSTNIRVKRQLSFGARR